MYFSLFDIVWMKRNLSDLPHTKTDEFLGSNSGFEFDYQFVNVDDFNGRSFFLFLDH